MRVSPLDDGKVSGDVRAPGRLLLGKHLHRLKNTELAIASMGKTVRSSSKNVAEVTKYTD